MQMIHILLKYILWCEFLSNLDAQSDFDKKKLSEKILILRDRPGEIVGICIGLKIFEI